MSKLKQESLPLSPAWPCPLTSVLSILTDSPGGYGMGEGTERPLPEVEEGAGSSHPCLGGPGPCPDAIFQVPAEGSVSLWGWV